MTEQNLENLWQARIGSRAAAEMRSWRRLSLILGLWYVAQVCFVLWVSVGSGQRVAPAVALVITGGWLLVALFLTVWWVRKRKDIRIHASGEISRQRRRVLVAPYSALTSIGSFDQWI